ncbi:hypothetical protein ACFPN2_35560 [Steroidobacter flavus]|uniref:Uncharacterized protein n=1 Tax=Steroidobacter flavus TaxID=1842136 RepID=A0ABV8T652_9GAMM
MPSAKTVSLDMHAMATLRYIRESMDAAGCVAVPGSAGIAMGMVGLAAMVLSLLPDLAQHWFAIWVAAGPIAALAGALLMTRSTSVVSFIATGTPGRKLLLGLIPCLFAGAVLTAVLWKANDIGAIPGAWLLLYGCSLISASAFIKMIVAWMGACFVALGVIAFMVPESLHVALLGLGFGGLHILFGILIGRDAHGR